MPPQGPPTETLAHLMWDTSRLMSDRLSTIMRKRFRLSEPEWQVLAALGDQRPYTQFQLGELTWLAKVTVSVACKGLQARGLVCRAGNPVDGRSHFVKPTERGLTMQKEIATLLLAFEQKLFARFACDERLIIRHSLQRVRIEAEEITPRVNRKRLSPKPRRSRSQLR